MRYDYAHFRVESPALTDSDPPFPAREIEVMLPLFGYRVQDCLPSKERYVRDASFQAFRASRSRGQGMVDTGKKGGQETGLVKVGESRMQLDPWDPWESVASQRGLTIIKVRDVG